ncbi:MAG: Hint domain-containing protein [Pseudomonadota bacterium]
MTNYVLDWDEVFTSGNAPSNTSVGTVDVSFSTSTAAGGAPTSQATTVSSDEFGAAAAGHLLLEMRATSSGQGFVQTISFDETGFPNLGVTDVTFTLLDVDRFFWEDQVQIIAYDVNGNALPSSAVLLVPDAGAGAAVVSGTTDTAQGVIEAGDDEAISNVDVTITGEVSRVDIVYTAGPNFPSGMIAQDIGIGPVSFTSQVIFDDSDGFDDGVVTATDETDIIFGNTIADGGLPGSAGDIDPTTPDDLINAGDGDDTVFGGAGNDTINGGEGEDNLRGGDGVNVINGDGGDDIIFGGSQMETLSGGADDDVIFGGGGTDVIFGNGGNDEVIIGAADAGSIGAADGGGDTDTLSIGFGTSATPVVVDIRGVTYQNFEVLDFTARDTDATLRLLDEQIGQFRTIFFDSIGSNTEVVEVTMDTLTTLDLSGVSPTQDDNDFIRVIGDGDAETITGTFQRDLLQGNGGNDSLDGGSGDDTLEGGAGVDTLIGGRGDDSLDGGSENDSVLGGMGDDTIMAAVGVSGLTATYDGGEDDDTLLLQGNQFFLQDAILRDIETLAFDSDVITRVELRSDQLEAFDAVTTETGRVFSQGVDVFLGDNTTADFSAITFTNFDQTFDSVFIRGDGDDETITGSQINDIISSSSGDDSLSGQDGDDTVLAGQGLDTFDGGEGNDALNFANVPVAGVRVDDNGDGTAFKVFASSLPTGQETFESVETFIGGDFSQDADIITLETAINAADVGAQIQGLSDVASGRFTSFDGTQTQFGLSADYRLSDILNGTAPASGQPVVGPAGEYEIIAGVAGGQIGNISFSEFENINFTVVDPDGVVTGEASAQFMGLGFTDLEGDMITTGNDVIDGVSGTDTIEADAGDDMIIAGDSGTQIDGGEGRDTYDATDQGRIQFLNVTDDGDGGLRKENLSGVPSNDSISNVEDYIAPDGPGSFDTITLRTAVQQSDIGTAIQDLSDDAAGTFMDVGGNSIAFGPGEGYLLSDILSGTAPAGLPAVGPVGSYEIGSGDETGQVGNISFENFERIIFTVEASADGVVDGANTGEAMGLGFVDAEGDEITDGADSILGNGGNDTIFAGAGDDTVDAGMGDDIVEGGAGADSLDGGEGSDTLSYATSAEQVVVNLATGSSVFFGDAAGDTFVNFENLTGSALGDALVGDVGDNVIEGGGGNDALVGGGGDDTLRGEGGNDRLSAQADDSTLAATYDGGEGQDSLEVDGSVFSLRASTITDIETLNYDAGNIDVTVELTPDQLESFNEVVTELGRSGTDHRIEVEMGSDNTADFSGVTFTNFDQSGDGLFILGDGDNETIIGSSLNDIIASGGGEDSLEGRDGDDVFGIFTGDYRIDGGAGNDIYDTAFVDLLVASVDDTGAGFSNKFFAGTQDAADSFNNIETFVAGEAVDESDAIFLTTDVQDTDVSTAISGLDDSAAGFFTDPGGTATAFGPMEDYDLSDILSGTSPDGVLPAIGPVGDYNIRGGDEDGQIGNIAFENFEDINFTVAATPDGVVDGTDDAQDMTLGFTDAQGDQITENADTILGNGGDDTIAGFGGDDLIEGGGGDDVFTYSSLNLGGLPADVIDNDTLVGGETGETAGDTLDASELSDAVTLTYTSAESGTISDVTATASFSEIETVRLGGGNDTVIGSAEAENVDAGLGADSLALGEGDDTIVATLTGADTIDGEGGTDIYEGDFARMTVQVDLSGDGSVTKAAGLTPSPTFPDVVDSITSVESFVGRTDGSDLITLTEEVEVSDVAGLPSDRAGSFIPSSGSGRPFGPAELYSFTDILNGTSPDGVLPAIGPEGTYTVSASDLDGEIAGISFDNFESITFTIAGPMPDGVVDGADTGEVMELGFVDTDGDQITTGADSIQGNGGADTIDGAGGADTIDAGAGDDLIVTNSSGDVENLVSVEGGEGTDTLQVNFTNATNDFAELGADVTGIEVLELDASFTGPNTDDITLRVDEDFAESLSTVRFGSTSPSNEEDISLQIGSGATIDLSGITIENASDGDGFVIFGSSTGNETITASDADDFINANLGDDVVDAGGGDDLVSNAGNDTVLGGSGDDTVVAGTGAGNVDGGEDTDTYTVTRFGLDFQTNLVVSVDENGNGTAKKTNSDDENSTDIISSIEHFVGAGDAGSVDVLNYQTEISVSDIGTAITGLDTATVSGFFFEPGAATPVLFGPTQDYTLGDIFAGTSPDGTLPAVGPEGDYQVEGGVDAGSIGGISYEQFEVLTFTVANTDDGVVDGTDDGQLMELGFTDAQGDQITTGADSIQGNGGDDTINGDAGDDTIVAGAGDDQIDGGEDNDTYDSGSINRSSVEVDQSGSGTVDQRAQFALSSDTDTVANIETFVAGEASSASDSFTMTDAVQASDVQDLSDDATGTFFSTAGGSVGFGPTQDYQLSDILAGTSPDGVLPAFGPAGDYEVTGGDESGQIGSVAFENFEDIFFTVVSTPDGVVDGTDDGQLMDLTFVDTQGDAVTSGADSIEGNGGADTIEAGAGNDTIDGGAGGDVINAGGDDDKIVASSGDDTIDGGDGTDSYDASDVARSSVTVNASGTGSVSLSDRFSLSPFATDTVENIENFVGSTGVGQNDINITALNDPGLVQISDDAEGTFFPADGSAGVNFGGSADYLLSDILAGTPPVSGGLPAVGPVGDYEINGGTDDGQVGDVSFENFEVINFTVIDPGDGIVDGTDDGQLMELGFTDADGDQITTGADSILGNGGADTIDGDAGNDTIDGGTGNDFIDGGDGDDSIIGGDGSESVDGGDGADFIDTSGPISLDPNNPLGKPDQGFPGLFVADDDPTNDNDTVIGGIGNDTIFTGDDNDSITAGDGDDVVDAGFDNDTVEGGDGNDFIEGGEGFDTLFGGLGDDTIYGGDQGFDVINIPDNAGDLRPDNGDDSIEGGAGNDLIFGQDDSDTIRGGIGNDTLDGGIDNDSIFGDDGDDDIAGGQGADTLNGGDGRDVFRFASVEDANGDVIDGGDGAGSTEDFDQLDLGGLGPYRIVNETIDADLNSTSGTVEFLDGAGGVTGSFDFIEIEKIICFTPGTRIITQTGYVPIEELRAGDRVMTRDNGFQDIAWIGQRVLSVKDLHASPKLQPVLIKRGALGPDLPDRDMMVSPNHRMLQMGGTVELHFGEPEVLTAAKHMTHHAGIETARVDQMTYIHMMFEAHQIVMADGCWTESFYPGEEAMDAASQEQREEIFELFPRLSTSEGRANFEAARPMLKRFEARLI